MSRAIEGLLHEHEAKLLPSHIEKENNEQFPMADGCC